MVRGRGGSGRDGGSGRGRNSGRGRVIYADIGQHVTSRKKKAKLGLYKALIKSIFTYGENNSVGKIQTTWEKVAQHIGIYLGQDIST